MEICLRELNTKPNPKFGWPYYSENKTRNAYQKTGSLKTRKKAAPILDSSGQKENIASEGKFQDLVQTFEMKIDN